MKLVYPPLNLPADWLTAWISRPDDPSAKWNAEDLEWLPANEWLSVNNFNVRLSPLEERELLLPIMPAREIPVQIHIQVQAHLRLPAEKLRPPLEFGFQLLPWSGWARWEGIVKVDRKEPYQFMLVPPGHILRLPMEYIPHNLAIERIYELGSYCDLHPDPIVEVEIEVVDEKGEPLKSSSRGMVLDRSVIAQFAESKLVDWLSEEDAAAFYTETDGKGQFIFPALPGERMQQGIFKPKAYLLATVSRCLPACYIGMV